MKSLIQFTLILLCCLFAGKSNCQKITRKMDNDIHAMTFLKEDHRFIWAQSDLGVVKINKHTYKSWLVSPKVIALPSPRVTGIVNDGKVTYVSTSRGIVYDDGSCTLIMSTDNTKLPENNIIGMKWACGGLLIRTKHYGWYLATGNPIKPFLMKKVDAAIKNGCEEGFTSL